MATCEQPPFDFLYLNSDGNYVSNFKAEYDTDCYLVYKNGFIIPIECVFEGRL